MENAVFRLGFAGNIRKVRCSGVETECKMRPGRWNTNRIPPNCCSVVRPAAMRVPFPKLMF